MNRSAYDARQLFALRLVAGENDAQIWLTAVYFRYRSARSDSFFQWRDDNSPVEQGAFNSDIQEVAGEYVAPAGTRETATNQKVIEFSRPGIDGDNQTAVAIDGVDRSPISDDPFARQNPGSFANSRPDRDIAIRNSASGEIGRDPVPVAEEIAPFLEGESEESDFHDRMEAEERDDSWAAYMEGQLGAYLASKSSLADFRIALLQCRTSMCEIQAIGYGPEANVIWFTAVADMPDQPWAVEFDDGNFKISEFGPDITSILMQFGRKDSDSIVNVVSKPASSG